jgi:hypothetical protein
MAKERPMNELHDATSTLTIGWPPHENENPLRTAGCRPLGESTIPIAHSPAQENGQPKCGAFVREGELHRWLGRVAEDRDGAAWLVAVAITDAIRNRSTPGDGILLGRLCGLTNMQPNVLVGVINRLRKRGRLQFTRTGDHDIASRFYFTIPSAAVEARWMQQRGTKV